jgi:hypothetical protein
MSSFFGNVGKKIKGVAMTMFVLETIGAIVAGISFIETDFGVLIILLGPMVALFSAWILYGFGEIVEHAYYCNQGSSVPYKPMPAPVPKPVTQAPVQHPAASPVQKAAPAAAPVVEKKPQVQPVTLTATEIAAGYWLCECGAKNKTLMCMDCGQPKK